MECETYFYFGRCCWRYSKPLKSDLFDLAVAARYFDEIYDFEINTKKYDLWKYFQGMGLIFPYDARFHELLYLLHNIFFNF